MKILYSKQALKFVGTFLLTGSVLISCPANAVAQAASSTEPIQDAQLTTEALPLLSTPAVRQERRCGDHALESSPCSVHGLFRNAWTEAKQFGHGLKDLPRASVRPRNLEWELPVLAATGVLIAKVDRPAGNRIQSNSLQQTAGQWSNVGLGLEIGAGAFAYGFGCIKHRSYLHDSGFKALAAMGAAGTVDLALKLAFDRQFPYTPGSTGKFWGGGRSFPSGHSATSFAFAALIAHRYPHKKWIKWTAYTLASGVALSRYPAKKHYPSDILFGSTIGYVAGTYLAEH